MNAVFFGDLIGQRCSSVFVQQSDIRTSNNNWKKAEETNKKQTAHKYIYFLWETDIQFNE